MGERLLAAKVRAQEGLRTCFGKNINLILIQTKKWLDILY